MLGQPITPLVITGTTYSSPNFKYKTAWIDQQHLCCYLSYTYCIFCSCWMEASTKSMLFFSLYCNTSIGMEEKTLLFTLDKKNTPIYKHVHVLAKNITFCCTYIYFIAKNRQSFHFIMCLLIQYALVNLHGMVSHITWNINP